LPAVLAVLFAAIHILGPRMKFLTITPRSIWLSIAGGVSVAYVFVHLLPELADYQETFVAAARRRDFLSGLEAHSYLIALVGLATFYGLDRLARQSARQAHAGHDERRTSASVFWIHLTSFAVYNFLVGYLLMHREEADLRGLLIYAVAMALHFVVNDQGLREQHGAVYDRAGRWPLAAAPLAGFLLGMSTTVSPVLLSALFAFLGGGVVLNVLKEELPEDRESKFWAFALGSDGYAALLLATCGSGALPSETPRWFCRGRCGPALLP